MNELTNHHDAIDHSYDDHVYNTITPAPDRNVNVPGDDGGVGSTMMVISSEGDTSTTNSIPDDVSSIATTHTMEKPADEALEETESTSTTDASCTSETSSGSAPSFIIDPTVPIDNDGGGGGTTTNTAAVDTDVAVTATATNSEDLLQSNAEQYTLNRLGILTADVLSSSTTSSTGTPTLILMSSEPPPIPIPTVLVTSKTILLPTGEEMNCKNTLQSFIDVYPNHTRRQSGGVSGISEISSVTELSNIDDRTLTQTIIGTPIISTTQIAIEEAPYSNVPPLDHSSNYNNNNTDVLPLHADAIAVTLPQADAYIYDENGENRNNKRDRSSWKNKYCCVALFIGFVVLLVGMVLGITLGLTLSRSNSYPTLAPSVDTNADTETLIQFQRRFISDYISQYINNITFTERHVSSDHRSTAEDIALQWLIENAVNDPEWIAFYEGNRDNDVWTNTVDNFAIAKKMTQLTQKYVLLSLWFQQVGDDSKHQPQRQFVESWTNNDGWLRHLDECKWYGITCEEVDVTTTTTLWSDKNIETTIPTGEVGNHSTFIKVVTGIEFATKIGYCSSNDDAYDVSLDNDCILWTSLFPNKTTVYVGNEFRGTLPIDLGLLTHLRVINFNHNNVSGSIPSSLGRLSNLTVLDVGQNLMTGSIPESLHQWTELTYFDVSFNSFNGTIFPSTSHFKNIYYFDASNNSLTGTIPELQWTSIQTFDLANNSISGSLPQSMQEWTDLELIHMSHNTLSGTIPTWIGTYTNMIAFSIANNSFTGTIPTSMQLWDNATYIDLSSNYLNGTVPQLLDEPQNLVYFNVTSNQLNGTLPSLGGYCDYLQSFSCEGNSFSGPIPASYGNCTFLQTLELSRNALTGTLPEWIFHSSLQTFRAGDNEFVGTIPGGVNESFGIPIFSSIFEIQNNMLSGPLPLYIDILYGLVYFDVSGNYFTGTIHNYPVYTVTDWEWASNISLTVLLQNNSFTGSVPEEICDFVDRLEADCDLDCTCCTTCYNDIKS